MPINFNFKVSKYAKIEIIFFLVYFYVVGLLSSFEYNLWEKKQVGISAEELEFAFVFGTHNLIAFLLFYKGLQYCLKKNNLSAFIGLIVLFLIGYFLFKKASYLLIAQMDFLSDKIRSDALKWYHLKRLGYTVNYMIIQLCGVSFLGYFIHSAKQTEQMKVLKEQQLISELTYLKAQLQPHFFFNTLNNIYALALKQSKDTAPLVAKLSEMMRYILYQSDQKMVLLKDEIAFIRNYVEVENIRYRSAIAINLDIQGIDDQGTISPLLLLPFIENAFKHGIAEEVTSGFVTIVICKNEDELTMEVGNSIAVQQEAKSGGIGLANVEKRLEILYPGQYQLDIQNDGKVYQVSLTLAMK